MKNILDFFSAPPATTEAAFALLAHLDAGDVPSSWRDAYAPDDAVVRIWVSTTPPLGLLLLVSQLDDEQLFVRALSVCARAAVLRAGGDAGSLETLDAIDAWTRGEVEALGEPGVRVVDALLSDGATQAAASAVSHIVRRIEGTHDVATVIAMVIACARVTWSSGLADVDARLEAGRAARNALSSALCEALPPPTLSALTARRDGGLVDAKDRALLLMGRDM